MRLTLLGTGAAGGVPLYGCECIACTRARTDPRYRRQPCAALIESGAEHILIDAGLMDLAERFAPGVLTNILLTHFHPDHVQGLFHLRWGKSPRLPVLTPPDSDGCADLYQHPGMLDFKRLRKFEPVVLSDLTVTPVPLIHSRVTYGYCFEGACGRIAYLTDTSGLPPNTERFLKSWGADVLVLDCSHPPQPQRLRNHNDLDMARAIRDALVPKRTILTHIGHDFDAWMIRHPGALDGDVTVARDGHCATPAGGAPLDTTVSIVGQACRDNAQ